MDLATFVEQANRNGFLKKLMEGGPVFVTTALPPAPCDLCGITAELRPYGPNGESICYACGQTMPEVVERRMGEMMNPANPRQGQSN